MKTKYISDLFPPNITSFVFQTKACPPKADVGALTVNTCDNITALGIIYCVAGCIE